MTLTLTVDALAQYIRAARKKILAWSPQNEASALLPMLEAHIAAGQQGAGDDADLLDDLARIYATIPTLPVTAETAEDATNALLAFCYLPSVRKALDSQILPPAPLGDSEDYLRPLRNAIGTADAYATGGPRSLRIVTLRMDEAEAMLARASLATRSPQPPKPAGGASLSDNPRRLPANPYLSDKGAGTLPGDAANAVLWPTPCGSIGGRWVVFLTAALAYGGAREASGRASVPDDYAMLLRELSADIQPIPQQPTADPLDAAIAKGTKAWAGVPDSFAEDLRGEGVGQQMTPQGEAAESKPTSDASDLLRLALADAWEHGKADAPFALEGCVAKVSAAFAEPAGREPVYQARVSGSMHAWVDTSEDEFAMTSEDHRRIVYAHPPPVADADQLSTVENIQAFARGYKAHQPKAKLTVHGIAHGLRALETHLAGGQTDA